MSQKIIIHDQDSAVYTVTENMDAIIIVLLRPGEQSVTVELAGRGAHAKIIGVGNLVGNNHTILHTLQHHQERETSSNLLVRAVLSDNASFSYDGAIRVEKNAQKTDAYQRNENLLLSDTTSAQSKPSLEILANDVRCTHGATISTIDPEQLFFLSTRGINPMSGKQLIVQGFLESVFSGISDTIELKKLREDLWQIL